MADTVFDRIQSEIDENPVFLYMKGTPMFPQCGFSARVVQILIASGRAVPLGQRAGGAGTA